MNKKLIADISNQVKSPSIVISADATNCHDRVTHPFASLTVQHFGVQLNYVLVLLKATQNMLMHLQTAHGFSASAYSRTTIAPFQGAAQDSRVAPVLWLAISIVLVRCMCTLGLVSEHCTPISGTGFQLAALTCVDDVDLNVLNLNQKLTLEVVE